MRNRPPRRSARAVARAVWTRVVEGVELLEIGDVEAGALDQGASGGIGEAFAGGQASTGQGPGGGKRRLGAFDQQDVESAIANGEGDDVDLEDQCWRFPSQ